MQAQRAGGMHEGLTKAVRGGEERFSEKEVIEIWRMCGN